MPLLDVPAGSPYGLANLPYAVFSPPGGGPRVGTRLGDHVLDLSVLVGEPWAAAPSLDPLLAAGYDAWVAARAAVTAAASVLVGSEVAAPTAYGLDEVTYHLPFTVADYVDYYASEHHATNLGELFRPGQPPLLPNWRHLPVGYHGRSGTVVVSGTDVVRPCGQRKAPDAPTPTYGPSVRLDIEAELGFVVGGGSALGSRISVEDAGRHLFGVVLVNDWSARDIQAWEYVPLGPYLGKSFATSISAWVTPLLALETARVPLPTQSPAVLPYLAGDLWGLEVEVEVWWNDTLVSRPPYASMYWSPAQMLAHMTVNGASTRAGDLFASGTISGPSAEQRGSFIELSWNGTQPLVVDGQPRTFLEDGDEVVLRASAPTADGGRLGLGECRGRILPARP